jgi:hypothetical protein
MCNGEYGNYIKKIYKGSDCSTCNMTDWRKKNTAFKHFVLVLKYVRYFFNAEFKVMSFLHHTFDPSANMLAMLVFDVTATTSTVPEETVRCETPVASQTI